jgi:diaminopimelate epimerase
VSGPAFVKGHGTQNDFVVLFDADSRHGLTESQVRALCDRRRGIGADGVLRVLPVESGSGWFMDYRNGDGSLAEMCGNGARVFAVALREAGLVASDEFVIATRGGDRPVRLGPDDVTVGMGAATTVHDSISVRVGVGTDQHEWDATAVWVPNPHAVAVVEDLSDAGRLVTAPTVTPPDRFPDGVNVEFIVDRGADPSDPHTSRIGMRVHERGIGETRSCGTGAVAAAWAWRRRSTDAAEASATTRVDVLGGTVYVTEHPDGQLDLRGPVVITAHGTLDDRWWKDNA